MDTHEEIAALEKRIAILEAAERSSRLTLITADEVATALRALEQRVAKLDGQNSVG